MCSVSSETPQQARAPSKSYAGLQIGCSGARTEARETHLAEIHTHAYMHTCIHAYIHTCIHT